jgi:hypothetical protein
MKTITVLPDRTFSSYDEWMKYIQKENEKK